MCLPTPRMRNEFAQIEGVRGLNRHAIRVTSGASLRSATIIGMAGMEQAL